MGQASSKGDAAQDQGSSIGEPGCFALRKRPSNSPAKSRNINSGAPTAASKDSPQGVRYTQRHLPHPVEVTADDVELHISSGAVPSQPVLEPSSSIPLREPSFPKRSTEDGTAPAAAGQYATAGGAASAAAAAADAATATAAGRGPAAGGAASPARAHGPAPIDDWSELSDPEEFEQYTAAHTADGGEEADGNGTLVVDAVQNDEPLSEIPLGTPNTKRIHKFHNPLRVSTDTAGSPGGHADGGDVSDGSVEKLSVPLKPLNPRRGRLGEVVTTRATGIPAFVATPERGDTAAAAAIDGAQDAAGAGDTVAGRTTAGWPAAAVATARPAGVSKLPKAPAPAPDAADSVQPVNRHTAVDAASAAQAPSEGPAGVARGAAAATKGTSTSDGHTRSSSPAVAAAAAATAAGAADATAGRWTEGAAGAIPHTKSPTRSYSPPVSKPPAKGWQTYGKGGLESTVKPFVLRSEGLDANIGPARIMTVSPRTFQRSSTARSSAASISSSTNVSRSIESLKVHRPSTPTAAAALPAAGGKREGAGGGSGVAAGKQTKKAPPAGSRHSLHTAPSKVEPAHTTVQPRQQAPQPQLQLDSGSDAAAAVVVDAPAQSPEAAVAAAREGENLAVSDAAAPATAIAPATDAQKHDVQQVVPVATATADPALTAATGTLAADAVQTATAAATVAPKKAGTRKAMLNPQNQLLPTLQYGSWVLTRIAVQVPCDACKGTVQMETHDGASELFQCDVQLAPGALAAACLHDAAPQPDGSSARKVWCFCPDPLCLMSKPEGSNLPAWSWEMPLQRGVVLSQEEAAALAELDIIPVSK